LPQNAAIAKTGTGNSTIRKPSKAHLSSLRVTCFGSSSKSTPQSFLSEAYELGLALAKGGHTCVNGAAKKGCIGSLNQGIIDGDGRVVGVMHEFWASVDGWVETDKRKIQIARGEGLQERKKMLVDGADAIVVLPGGVGTFDELWEIACEKCRLKIDIPIVCVNVDGYYSGFESILKRANDDSLLKKKPQEVVRFESSSVRAVEWIEAYMVDKQSRKNDDNGDITTNKVEIVETRPKNLTRLSSHFVTSLYHLYDSMINGEYTQKSRGFIPLSMVFIIGVAVGASIKKR